MIAPASLRASSVTPRTSGAPGDADDALFADPWCRAARAAGLAPWRYDVATDRLVWSHALHAALGHPALPSAPTVRWWMTQVHPDDAAEAARAYDAIGAGQAETWRIPYRLRRADGGYAAVIDIGAAVRGPGGALVQLVGYVDVR
ncbi:MAG: PAS domain-containing protein [Gemmatimonadaceae bacterium]|jgi:PAS domain-containing protein|nr:PAS domain-containing protein [Gemmatimonadaceae bacterium]